MTIVTHQKSLASQSTRKLPFSTLLDMLQKQHRNNSSALTVARPLAPKATHQIHVSWYLKVVVSFTSRHSVIKVCEKTEKCFERMLATTGRKLPHVRGIPDAITVSVLGDLNIVYRI